MGCPRTVRTRLLVLCGGLAVLGAGCTRTAPLQLNPAGGVYRSDDGGTTFVQRSTVARNGNLTRATFREVVFPPTAPGTLYLVTNQGVYRTTSSGDRWQRLPVPAKEVLGISVHPNNPEILLAATISSVRDRGRILRSLDGGQTWAEAFTAPSTTQVRGVFYQRRVEVPTHVTAIARDPHHPEVVLAGTNTGILLVSEDGGTLWRSKRAFSQGISGLKFSPTVPGRLFIRRADGRLTRSPDRGETVQITQISRRAAQAPEGLGDPSLVRLPQSDIVNTVLFLRPTTENQERILVGTAAGLYQSIDGGENWSVVPLPPTGGLVDIPVKTLTETPDGTIWASAGFVLFSSRDGGTTWRGREAPARAFVRFILADPVNPQRLFLFLVPSSPVS